jgi:hypothetical protein
MPCEDTVFLLSGGYSNGYHLERQETGPSLGTIPASALVLDFPASKIVRNRKHVLYKSSNQQCFVTAAQMDGDIHLLAASIL